MKPELRPVTGLKFTAVGELARAKSVRMFGKIEMTALTIRRPDDTCHRLKQLAVSRGISLNKRVKELNTVTLTSHDTEIRFRALTAKADRKKALDILERLDATDRQQVS